MGLGWLPCIGRNLLCLTTVLIFMNGCEQSTSKCLRRFNHLHSYMIIDSICEVNLNRDFGHSHRPFLSRSIELSQDVSCYWSWRPVTLSKCRSTNSSLQMCELILTHSAKMV